ncbi:MAG: ABC transporter substrate-binding protein [Deltaproteobacteria bacterium]|nr:ABC transporter substrate-binding protein [Deltaproteobacteria bacterium]
MRQRAGKPALVVAFVAAILGLAAAERPAVAQERIVFASTAGGAVGFITEMVSLHRLDERQGVKLDVKLFTPEKAEEAVFFKQVDAGLFPPLTAARAQARGAKIRIFGPLLWNHISLLVPTDSAVRGVEELRGKKIGTLPRISGMYTTFSTVLRMRGMDFEKDFRPIFGAPVALLGFFDRRDVDALLHFEPFVSRLLVEGKAREVVKVNDLWKQLTGQPMLMIGLAAHQEWIQANPARARRLAAALAAGIAYIRERPEQALQEGRKGQGIRSDAELALLKQRYPVVFPERWDAGIIRSAQVVVDKAVEYGFLERAPTEPVFIKLD